MVHLPSAVAQAREIRYDAFLAHGGATETDRFSQNQQDGHSFENHLQRSCCYSLGSSMLTLMVQKGQLLIMLSSPQQEGIENQRWRIASYRGGGSSSTQKDEMITAKEATNIVFTKGQIQGLAGCGGWRGSYTISGNNLVSDISFELVGLCSSEQLMQATSIEADLRGDRRIEMDNSGITLRAKNGMAMILLVPF